MRRYWDAHLLIRNWKPNKKDKDATKRYQKIHQTKINKEIPMSKVPVSPEWFLFMAPTLVSWPPKGEIHQATWLRKSTLKLMNLEFGIQKYHEILLIFHGFACFFPATNGKSDKFDPRKPADLSGLHAAWSGMQRGCCGICISKSMRIRRSFNDGRFWSKQRTNLSTSGWHNQPVAGNLGAAQKKSNRSKIKLILTFLEKKKRTPKKKLPFFKFGEEFFWGGLCNSHPKKKRLADLILILNCLGVFEPRFLATWNLQSTQLRVADWVAAVTATVHPDGATKNWNLWNPVEGCTHL